ncbi:hypothetical protein DASC09_051660 [Saccharomycopsis crataegensis]|uniref:Uncharacterized protein n=1 Tax=Saccharomycopsis crataegensis TaxID=43959 RepID=A0AAV5QT07_9ASCO|nr:hypothetical protein DASC09_051660 [Saccharomycopsis crataegensis]
MLQVTPKMNLLKIYTKIKSIKTENHHLDPKDQGTINLNVTDSTQSLQQDEHFKYENYASEDEDQEMAINNNSDDDCSIKTEGDELNCGVAPHSLEEETKTTKATIKTTKATIKTIQSKKMSWIKKHERSRSLPSSFLVEDDDDACRLPPKTRVNDVNRQLMMLQQQQMNQREDIQKRRENFSKAHRHTFHYQDFPKHYGEIQKITSNEDDCVD